MDKIHITFVVTNCKKSGPINQTLNIIRYMDRNRFTVSLITIFPEEKGNSMLDMYQALKIDIYQVNISKWKSVFLGKSRVGRILAEIKPDIVQGIGIPPYRMTLGYKEAIHFVTLRNYCYEDYPDQYGKKIGPLMASMDMCLIRQRMRMGEPFVTCSNSLTQMYREKQNIDIPFIRNGVEVSKYKKRNLAEVLSLRRKIGLPVDKKIFVYSGRLIDRKNQEEAVRAFVKAKNNDKYALVILGDGPNRISLEKMGLSHPNIFFFGEVSNIPEFLQASDVYISTSKSEGLPNGVLEAMATGLPVLLSDIPQHMEVLETDLSCGHFYALGNVEQLTHFIEKMPDEPLVEMGEKSYRAVMENFTAEGMSRKYQKTYIDMVSQRG